MVAFWIPDEPLPLKSGQILTKRSDPFWYRMNFVVLFGMGAAALLACTVLMLTA